MGEGTARIQGDDAPRLGRDVLVAHERAVLARVRSVQSRCVRPVFVDGDRVVVRWVFRFEGNDGRVREIEELAYQRWQGDRIAQEQFFYDVIHLSPAKTSRSRFAPWSA